MALFKISKGLASKLPTTYNEGYCYFTTDDGKFYIDTTNNAAGRIAINAVKADEAATLKYSPITITSADDDTTIKWGNNKFTYYFYTTAASSHLENQPSSYGILANYSVGTDVHQLWMTQPSGNIFHRGGNVSGWGGNGSGTWRTILDSVNYNSYALPLSGGTMTGTLTLQANQFADSLSGALNANGSNIYNLNALYFANVSDSAAEGIHFIRTNNHVDSLWAKDGNLYFNINRTLGNTGTSNTVLHSGNYNSYAPTLTGTGASGSWGISITGNAATATTATNLAASPTVIWAAGTTAGPTLAITAGNKTSTAVAIPSASETASGIVTTSTQYFSGRKFFKYRNLSIMSDTTTDNTFLYFYPKQKDVAGYVSVIYSDSSTDNFYGRVYFHERSFNTSDGTSTGKGENYYLPVPNANMTETKTYNILTSKTPVTAAQGGTGKTTLVDGANAFINALTVESTTPTDNDYFISQYVGGGTTNTTYHRRALSTLYTYIKTKAQNSKSSETWDINLTSIPSIILTSGTTAGPTLAITAGGQTSAAVTLPAATTEQSGVVTTGSQTFTGTKSFNSDLTANSNLIVHGNAYFYSYITRFYGNSVATTNTTSSSATAFYFYNSLQTTDDNQTTTTTHAINGILYSRTYLSNYRNEIRFGSRSYSSTGTDTTKFEYYCLPQSTNGLTADKTYDIITNKDPDASLALLGGVAKKGDTMTGNLTIQNTLYPSIKLSPTKNNTTNITVFEGSYLGASSFAAWEDSAGNNRRMLEVRTAAYASSLDNAVLLRTFVNGTNTNYQVYHSGMSVPADTVDGWHLYVGADAPTTNLTSTIWIKTS